MHRRTLVTLFTLAGAFGVAACSDLSRVTEPEQTAVSSPRFSITGGAPAAIKIVDGDNQTGLLGKTLNPLDVRVVDASGNPVGGARVKFTVTLGSGTVSPISMLTGSDGYAYTFWTMPLVAGTYKLKVSLPYFTAVPTVTYTANAVTQAQLVSAVSVNPGNLTSAAGKSWPFTAVALDAAGDTVANVTPAWSSSNPAVATVDAAGMVTAVATGKATIQATVGTTTGAAVITVPPPNQPPVAKVNGPYTGTHGIGIAFSSAGSYDPEGGALSFVWRFGDGTPLSFAANPSHIYKLAGTYTVSVTATDPAGLQSTASATVTVK